MDRAYSIFEVKAYDDDARTIKGMATTPSTDRQGDIVEPLGLKFAKTIPLFLYHDSTKTVGLVELGAPTKEGVPFIATIPKIMEAGNLRDRVDEAWQMVKYKLIAAVSIGFLPDYDKTERLKTGGLRFLEAEIFELSLVPVPANAEATITHIRSFDTTMRAAPGEKHIGAGRDDAPPGVSGNKPAAPRGAVKLIPRKKS